ncbi:TIGR04197 family type VII secretion effector [Granulicatella adiacens]|uniref:TIGR04197 family type VII secretion effector n=1 Tax=Granulicatella adiacens TaxID=46124 RepID=UPI0021D8D4D0|nr:TIGR04197 family type VII secretion effector [Granulicatella adiacens]UXY41783.1 TIGR04197 family type VII secretion effector [Granulicatella adiacens]
MVEIKNDILVATEQSALLSKAVSDLDNTKEVAKDMQSKLNGNEKAKELIEKSFDISKAVSQVMKTMSNNLLTTSQSFQEKDEQIEKQMENLLIRNVEGFTLNGPVKQ